MTVKYIMAFNSEVIASNFSYCFFYINMISMYSFLLALITFVLIRNLVRITYLLSDFLRYKFNINKINNGINNCVCYKTYYLAKCNCLKST